MTTIVYKYPDLSTQPINYSTPIDENPNNPFNPLNDPDSKIQFNRWVPKSDEPVNENETLVGKQISSKTTDTKISIDRQTFPSGEIISPGTISNRLDEAIKRDDLSAVKALIDKHPKEFKAALLKKDKLEYTPVFWVTIKGKRVVEYFSLMAAAAPEEFKTTVDFPDRCGNTILSILVRKHALNAVEFLATFAPIQFKKVLVCQNENGNTPVALAVINNDIEMLKLMAKYALGQFKLAMTMQNNKGETPLLLAGFDVPTLKYMHSVSSLAFRLASAKRDNCGMSLLDIVKRIRPHDYREISKIYGKDSLITIANKEISNRIALSHFFNLSGHTEVMAAKSKEPYATIDLEGWRSPQWFNRIEKDLHQFRKIYPFSMGKNEMDQLIKACRVEADYSVYSFLQRFLEIKNGMGFISTGFAGHEVTLLIWGNWFIICNRGDASKGAVEFFKFNPEKLNFKLYEKILNLSYGTKENYEDFLYEQLPVELELVKTPLAKELEKNNYLFPVQSVSNCSLVSPITALYAYRLLFETKGVKNNKKMKEHRQHAVNWHHTWLNFQRISILERNIRPLINNSPLNNTASNNTPFFKPDHALISECLCRAHVLDVDNLSENKLKTLTNAYLNSIDDLERRNELKIKLNQYSYFKKRYCF